MSIIHNIKHVQRQSEMTAEHYEELSGLLSGTALGTLSSWLPQYALVLNGILFLADEIVDAIHDLPTSTSRDEPGSS